MEIFVITLTQWDGLLINKGANGLTKLSFSLSEMKSRE